VARPRVAAPLFCFVRGRVRTASKGQIMVDTQAIDKALQLNELTLPPGLRITDIVWDWFEDSDGEQTLEIIVVLDDETTDREIEQAPIHEIKRAIIDSLAEQGVSFFPYFYFERESEHEAPVREE
jgi:hypothetical protein